MVCVLIQKSKFEFQLAVFFSTFYASWKLRCCFLLYTWMKFSLLACAGHSNSSCMMQTSFLLVEMVWLCYWHRVNFDDSVWRICQESTRAYRYWVYIEFITLLILNGFFQNPFSRISIYLSLNESHFLNLGWHSTVEMYAKSFGHICANILREQFSFDPHLQCYP